MSHRIEHTCSSSCCLLTLFTLPTPFVNLAVSIHLKLILSDSCRLVHEMLRWLSRRLNLSSHTRTLLSSAAHSMHTSSYRVSHRQIGLGTSIISFVVSA